MPYPVGADHGLVCGGSSRKYMISMFTCLLSSMPALYRQLSVPMSMVGPASNVHVPAKCPAHVIVRCPANLRAVNKHDSRDVTSSAYRTWAQILKHRNAEEYRAHESARAVQGVGTL